MMTSMMSSTENRMLIGTLIKMIAMQKEKNANMPVKSIAIARAQFCWETEAYSGRVLHYYGEKDGSLRSYPDPKEIEAAKRQNKVEHK